MRKAGAGSIFIFPLWRPEQLPTSSPRSRDKFGKYISSPIAIIVFLRIEGDFGIPGLGHCDYSPGGSFISRLSRTKGFLGKHLEDGWERGWRLHRTAPATIPGQLRVPGLVLCLVVPPGRWTLHILG